MPILPEMNSAPQSLQVKFCIRVMKAFLHPSCLVQRCGSSTAGDQAQCLLDNMPIFGYAPTTAPRSHPPTIAILVRVGMGLFYLIEAKGFGVK